MDTTPQGQETARPTHRDLYNLHVNKAYEYEQKIKQLQASWKQYYQDRNPNASKEWIEEQVGDKQVVKSAIGNQQHHVRMATMYGLGMVAEACGMTFGPKDS